MAILQVPMQVPGMVGVQPNFKFMVTTDNLSTITTAGYLNSVNLEANPVSTTDILNVLYSFNQQTQVGTYEQFSISLSNGVITLVPLSSAGEVTLPTTANHIATYTNTTGHLSEDPTIAISGGSLQAGLSGTAGTLISYPATASKGSLIVAGVANTGNTTTTISNAAMGQASVISIPDPGTATADFAVAPLSLVSGNLVKASGTAGLIIDSGIVATSLATYTGSTVIGNLVEAATTSGEIQDAGISVASITTALKTQTAIVTLNTAAVTGMYAAPALIVASPGAGFALMPIACQIITVVSTAFATGGIAQLQWGATVHAGGTVCLDTTTPAAEITAAASQIYTQYGVPTTTATAIATANNLGLYFTNASAAFTSGTGSTVTIAVTYMVIPV